MACCEACPTRGHGSYAECLRAKSLRVMPGTWIADQRMVAENAAYRAALAEGLQPAAPTFEAVDRVRREADERGHA